jgi:hypothetical protein
MRSRAILHLSYMVVSVLNWIFTLIPTYRFAFANVLQVYAFINIIYREENNVDAYFMMSGT